MRPVAASAAILGFVVAYVVAALLLAERLAPMPGLVQAVYWCVAGLIWVLPVRWLMLWGAGKR